MKVVQELGESVSHILTEIRRHWHGSHVHTPVPLPRPGDSLVVGGPCKMLLARLRAILLPMFSHCLRFMPTFCRHTVGRANETGNDAARKYRYLLVRACKLARILLGGGFCPHAWMLLHNPSNPSNGSFVRGASVLYSARARMCVCVCVCVC